MSMTKQKPQMRTPWMTKLKHISPRKSVSTRWSSESSAPSSPIDDYVFSPSKMPSALLTPLDVHETDYFTPLIEKNNVQIGEMTLPPPPPKQKRKTTALGSPIPNCEPVFLKPQPPTPTGPKVKPYVVSTNSASNQNMLKTENCFICNESLEIKLESEKIIPLVCGDCVHQECLLLAVQFQLERSQKLGILTNEAPHTSIAQTIFPPCKGNQCYENGPQRCLPVDKTIIDDHIKKAKLSLKLAKVSDHQSYTLVTPRSSSRLSSQSSIPDGFSLISPAGTHSPASSDCTDITTSMKVKEHLEIPLESLKSAFILEMLEKAPLLDLSMLVSLGNLRLVDELLVSNSNAGPFVLMTVYLFTHFLVLIPPHATENTMVIALDNGSATVQMPTPSVLQIVTASQTVCLHSRTSSIIEKWGIGVSDPLINFPSTIFTSTIELSQLKQTTTYSPKPKSSILPILESSESMTPSPQTSNELTDLIKDLDLADDRSSLDLPLPSISTPTSPLRIRTSTHTLPYHIDSPSLSGEEGKFEERPQNVFKAPSFDREESYQGLGFELESDSDSDADSDEELIESVMKSKKY